MAQTRGAPMNSILIRKATRNDMGSIARLIRLRDGINDQAAARRTRLFEWIAFENPYPDKNGTYFLAEDRGTVVGHLGRMPMDFLINGRVQRAYFPHDLFVHPDYRNKGMGLFISMSLYKALENDSKSFFCCMWISPVNLEIQRLRKYHEVDATRYVRFINPRPKIGEYMKYPWAASLCSTGLTAGAAFYDRIHGCLIPSTISVSRIERFDERFDAYNERVSARPIISQCKTSHYLNWKYIDRPYSRFTCLAAFQNGEVKGYIILSPDPAGPDYRGIIVDISVDMGDPRTLSALFNATVRYFRERNAESVECLVTNKALAKSLTRCLFFRAYGKEPITFWSESGFPGKDTVMDIGNWLLTHGDSDGFMWV